jgi:hypothetical protein
MENCLGSLNTPGLLFRYNTIDKKLTQDSKVNPAMIKSLRFYAGFIR